MDEFPRPWRIEEKASAFNIVDSSDQALATVYFREPANTARAAKALTRDQAAAVADFFLGAAAPSAR